MPTSIARSFPGTASLRCSYGHSRGGCSRPVTATGPADNNLWLRHSQGGWLFLQQIYSQQPIDIISKILILLSFPKFRDLLNHSDCPSVNPSLQIWRN